MVTVIRARARWIMDDPDSLGEVVLWPRVDLIYLRHPPDGPWSPQSLRVHILWHDPEDLSPAFLARRGAGIR